MGYKFLAQGRLWVAVQIPFERLDSSCSNSIVLSQNMGYEFLAKGRLGVAVQIPLERLDSSCSSRTRCPIAAREHRGRLPIKARADAVRGRGDGELGMMFGACDRRSYASGVSLQSLEDSLAKYHGESRHSLATLPAPRSRRESRRTWGPRAAWGRSSGPRRRGIPATSACGGGGARAACPSFCSRSSPRFR